MNIKDIYLNYFQSVGHKIIPSAPIIPENDPTCLFNTAGMQPLVPYLKGEPHPLGKRLCDVQKCLRLTDLEEVGDTTHHTFFEMLGNWSLGDYFKKESITYSFDLLTKHFNIDISKLAVTVFKGNDLVSADSESAEIWKSLGIPEDRIAYLGEDDNWWPNMESFGPCGPDTEIFYYRGENVPEKFNPEDDNWVEIWNNVFMQYNHDENGFNPLVNKNVDTGMGVERITAVLEGKNDNYESSLWKDIIEKIEELSSKKYEGDNKRIMRIIADHIRSAVFIASDNAKVVPSNTDQGYILRRLIRRYIRFAKELGIDINTDFDIQVANIVINNYKKYYPELEYNKNTVYEVLTNEKNKFSKTLEKGLKEFEKVVSKVDKKIDKELAFHLYDTYGFPIELTCELAEERHLEVDVDGFNEEFKIHQEKSRAGAEKKFKGGLAGGSDIEIKYHTATHLLNAALKLVIGNDVHQKGSNITPDRMRFDFPCDHKMTAEEIKKTEDIVNGWIKDELDVVKKEMSKEEALKIGAEAMFIEKYGEKVTVYFIGDVSKELCGGPHVSNTRELGHFKIVKEESSSAGIRRIKAILD